MSIDFNDLVPKKKGGAGVLDFEDLISQEPSTISATPTTVNPFGAFEAAPEPSFLQQAFRTIFPAKEPQMPIAYDLPEGRKYRTLPPTREEQPLIALKNIGEYYASRYITGRGLYLPDVTTRFASESRSFSEALNKETGFVPTRKEQQIGSLLDFMGSIKTMGALVGPAVAKLPVRATAQRVIGGGLTFGARATTEQVAKKITEEEPISPLGIAFETAIGMGFGLLEGAVARVKSEVAYKKFIKAHPEAKAYPKKLLIRANEAMSQWYRGLSRYVDKSGKVPAKHRDSVLKLANRIKRIYGKDLDTLFGRMHGYSQSETQLAIALKEKVGVSSETAEQAIDQIRKGVPVAEVDKALSLAKATGQMAVRPATEAPIPAPEPTPAVRPLPPEQMLPPRAEVAHPGEGVEAEKARKPLKPQEVIAEKEKYTPTEAPTGEVIERKAPVEALAVTQRGQIDAQLEAAKGKTELFKNKKGDILITEETPTGLSRVVIDKQANIKSLGSGAVDTKIWKPAPTPAKPAKEPWEMTTKEYIRGETHNYLGQKGINEDRRLAYEHINIVKKAVEEGKSVPRSVLETVDIKGEKWAQQALAPTPAEPTVEKPTAEIKVGDIIRDDLVRGRVLGEGSIKFGKKQLPAYKVEILSGHEKGKISLIAKEEARLAKPTERRIRAPIEQLGGLPQKPPGLTKAEIEHLGAREQRALRAGQARGYPIGYKLGKREAIRKARNEMFNFRMAKKLSDDLRKKAAGIVKQYVPKEKQYLYTKRILEAKTPHRVEKLSEAISTYIDKAEHRQAVGEFKNFVQKTLKTYRRGEERLGKLRSDVRDKVISVFDEYDPTKLTEKKERKLEHRDSYIKRASGTVADAFESLEEDGADILQMPNARISELNRLSKTHVGELDADQIRYVQSSLEHLIAIAERKGQVKERIRAEKVGKLVNTARQEVSPRVTTKGVVTEWQGIIGGLKQVATTEQATVKTLAGMATGKDNAATKELLIGNLDKGYYDKTTKIKEFALAAREEMKYFTSEDSVAMEKKEKVALGGKIYHIDMDSLLSIYQSIKAEGNLRRLLKTKGLDITVYERNPKTGYTIKSKKTLYTSRPRLSELRDIVELIESKYPKFKQLSESAFKLNWDVQGPALNKTSMEFQNYELARKERYWPVHRVMPIGVEGKATDISVSIENQGRYLERTGGNERIKIVPFRQDFVSGLQSDAAFSGMVLPLRDVKALLGDKKWQDTMKKQGRGRELNALITMFRRIQGQSTDRSIIEQMGSKVLNNFGKSVLSLRLSGYGVQTASIPAAYEVIDPKYFHGMRNIVNLARIPIKAVKEMKDLSPILWLRWEARQFNFVTGGVAAQNAFNNLVLGKTPITDKLLNQYTWGDQKAIYHIYLAAQNKVATETKLKRGTAEFKKEAIKITEEALDTQPQWDVTKRTPLTSSPNVILRGSLMFMSARNAQYNVLQRVADDYRKGRIGAGEAGRRTRGVVYANVLVGVVKRLIKSGIKLSALGLLALMGDEEKKERAREAIKKEPAKIAKQLPIDSVLNFISLPAFGGMVGNVAYETIKRIKRPNIPLRSMGEIRTGNIFADLSLDIGDLGIGLGLLSRYLITDEKFKSGPDKGKPKWIREATKVGSRLAELIAIKYGLPYSAPRGEIYWQARGAAKLLEFDEEKVINKAYFLSQLNRTPEEIKKARKYLKNLDVTPEEAQEYLDKYWARERKKTPISPLERDRVIGRIRKRRRLKERMEQD